MGSNFKAAEFLFKKMKSLYSTFEYPDEFDVELWEEILEGNSQVEILDALKSYRKTVEYNKAPTPAEFKRFLNARSAEDMQSMRGRIFKCADELGNKFGKEARERYLNNARKHWPDVDFTDNGWQEPYFLEADRNTVTEYANKFMHRDLKLNRCHHFLPMYEKAVRYIAEEMLSREIPSEIWKSMNYAARCEKAMKLGLFNEFDDALVSVCRNLNGVDYQF